MDNINPCSEIALGEFRPVMPWVQVQVMQSLRARLGLKPYTIDECVKIEDDLILEHERRK